MADFRQLVMRSFLRRAGPNKAFTLNGQIGEMGAAVVVRVSVRARRVGRANYELRGEGHVGELPCEMCGVLATGARGPELTFHLSLGCDGTAGERPGPFRPERVSGLGTWQDLPRVALPAGAAFSAPVRFRGESAELIFRLDYRELLGLRQVDKGPVRPGVQ